MMILLCALVAAGILLVLWVTIGWLLMPFSIDRCTTVVFVKGNEDRLEQQLRAFRWLTDCGLIRCRMLLVAEDMTQWELANRVAANDRWAQCIWKEDLPISLG